MKVAALGAAFFLSLALSVGPSSAGSQRQGVAAYRHGDYQAALAEFRPLAWQGGALAQFSLGVMYDDGRGLPENYGLALKWYLKAADQGLADAQFMAGMIYAAGRGRAQDPVRAYFWLNLAAAGGYPKAERARDQEEAELTEAEKLRVQKLSVVWFKKRRAQIRCGPQRCIHPKWIDKPRYSIFD